MRVIDAIVQTADLTLYSLNRKTIQSIGFLHELQRVPKAKNRGPFLVVAPLSLVA